MERTRPRSSSDLDSAIQDPARQDPLAESDPGWVVMVWEHRRSRLQLISRVVSESKGRPKWVEGLSAIQEVEISSQCSVAIVALGAYPSPADLGLQVIRTLKQKGFKVVCYEDGAQSWPLGIQCLALVAGSLRLLDSAKEEFAQELRSLLVQLLRAEAGRQDEEERIKNAMKNLGVVGESQPMISVFRWILRVAPLSDLPILIMGETGTGKQLLAHAIYQLDPKRRNGPFVAVNCGAISASLAESELFGHRRGAYTGAERDRKGLIRSAHGGILFLDEISELDDALQAKLLRVLQENRVLGVGEDQEVPVSIRVIAATNRELPEMVREGGFRADLFHRLNVVSIHIPPLRERSQDVKPLIGHFLNKFQSLNPAASIAAGRDFVEALTQVELPGNARQLENLVRQALVQKKDDTPLNLSDLPREVWHELSGQVEDSLAQPEEATERKDIRKSSHDAPRQDFPSYLGNLLESNRWSLSSSLQYCEKLMLETALHVAHGNQSQAARLLGITPRSVYNKVRKHRLDL